jgi:hypothetical protein
VLTIRVICIFAAAQFSVTVVAVVVSVVSLLTVPMFLVAANRLYAEVAAALRWRLGAGRCYRADGRCDTSDLAALSGAHTVVALACQILASIAVYVILIRVLAPDLFRRGIATVGVRKAG